MMDINELDEQHAATMNGNSSGSRKFQNDSFDNSGSKVPIPSRSMTLEAGKELPGQGLLNSSSNTHEGRHHAVA